MSVPCWPAPHLRRLKIPPSLLPLPPRLMQLKLSKLSPCFLASIALALVAACYRSKSPPDIKFSSSQTQVQLPVSSEPVTRAMAAKSPEVCGPLLYNKSRRYVWWLACVVPDDCEGGCTHDGACFEVVGGISLCVFSGACSVTICRA